MRDKQVTTVWWDFDGTLVHHTRVWCTEMADILSEMGYDVPESVVISAMDDRFFWHNSNIGHTDIKDSDDFWVQLGRTLLAGQSFAPGLDESDFMQRFRHVFCDPTTWVPYPDTITALQIVLDSGCKNIIVSNHVPELESIIDEIGLTPYFDKVVNSGTLGWEKPNPHIFEAALGSAAPHSAVMIGDNPHADKWGAEQMGVPGFVVHSAENGRKAPTLLDALSFFGFTIDRES